MTSDAAPLLCDRCLTELTPGHGDYYLVSIEAVADPTPPSFSEEDLSKDVRQEIDELVAKIKESSGQELMDQVYRRVTLYLCGPCYRDWIEKPTG